MKLSIVNREFFCWAASKSCAYLFLIRAESDDKGFIHSRSHFMSHIMWTDDCEVRRVCLSYLHQTSNLVQDIYKNLCL